MQVGQGNDITSIGSHSFLMKKLNAKEGDSCLIVDFSPVFSKNLTGTLKAFPVYNFEQKVYLPTFSVPADKETFKEYQKVYQAIHYKKVIEAVQEKRQIFVPKPSKKNHCCIVCKVCFDDYLTHVNSPNHLKSMKSSPFDSEIRELCQNFESIKFLPASEVNCEDLREKPKKKRKCETKRKSVKHQQTGGASTMVDTVTLFQNRNLVQIGS